MNTGHTIAVNKNIITSEHLATVGQHAEEKHCCSPETPACAQNKWTEQDVLFSDRAVKLFMTCNHITHPSIPCCTYSLFTYTLT